VQLGTGREQIVAEKGSAQLSAQSRMQSHILRGRSSVHTSSNWCNGPLPQRRIARRGAIAQASVTPPPVGYDYRTKVEGSLQFIEQHHPDLTDLAREGQCMVRHAPVKSHAPMYMSAVSTAQHP
jgi:hypothetical protein